RARRRGHARRGGDAQRRPQRPGRSQRRGDRPGLRDGGRSLLRHLPRAARGRPQPHRRASSRIRGEEKGVRSPLSLNFDFVPTREHAGRRSGGTRKLLRRFRPELGLRWRLTLSYTLVTVAAVLALQLAVLFVAERFLFDSTVFPTLLAGGLADLAP